MYGNYMPIERLTRQKEELENLIKNYQQQPVNNFINTTQQPNKDLIEWRVLNENEEVDNLYVSNKTLFINDNLMVLKGVDGSLQKWQVKKIYPIDKKDEKIQELENKIKELEMKINEPIKFTSTIKSSKEPNTNDDEYAKPKSKNIDKSITK